MRTGDGWCFFFPSTLIRWSPELGILKEPLLAKHYQLSVP